MENENIKEYDGKATVVERSGINIRSVQKSNCMTLNTFETEIKIEYRLVLTFK